MIRDIEGLSSNYRINVLWNQLNILSNHFRYEEPLIEQSKAMLKSIIQINFKSENIDVNSPNFDEIMGNIFSDAGFVMPNVLSTKFISQKSKSPIYHYRYAHRGSFTICDLMGYDTMKFLGKQFFKMWWFLYTRH